MASTRPSWTGHLRFSLVTIPVQLYSGSKSVRNIPLHLIHKPTGKRVHYQSVVEGVGKIDKKSIIKGYEYKKGQHVTLTPEELDKIRLPTNKTINITEFVDAAEIDQIYFDKPYFVIPQGDIALEAYAVFHDALTKTGKVAVGEVILSGKEHLVSIKPYGKGMMLETLRYADEVRSAHSLFEDMKAPTPDKEQLELAVSLIKKKSSKFKPEDYDDSYETALHELIDRKLKKLPLERQEDEFDNTNVVSLMDALKKSLGKGKASKAATKKPVKKSAPNNTKKAAPKKKAPKKVAAKRKRA